jgi:hypothetical protein
MTITLLSAVARHERRVRLVFDGALALAAFTSTNLYAVTTADGTVVAVSGLVGLLGMPNEIDLALGADLATGTAYGVTASGVPGADGSTTPLGTSATVRLAVPPAVPADAEITPDDVTEVLYGVDLVWANGDYVEDVAGDLATVTGPDNVQAALMRRFASDGLPWDDTYGARPRRYVDGSPLAVPNQRGALVRQARLDDRVKTARVTVSADASELEVSVQLIGDDVVLNVPAPKTS